MSRVAVDRSEASLRRVVAETVAAVEQAYWNVIAARRDVAIRESTLALADRQREDARIRVEAQVVPESDLAQFTAEIERRRGDLYASRETATRAELLLKALILDSADAPQWGTTLALDDPPPPVPAAVDVAAALKAAAERPELADLDARRALQAIELDAARDRLKPQLDIVGGYTARGVAGARSEDVRPFPGLTPEFSEELQGALGASLESVALHRFPDVNAGLVLTIPLGQRAARADIAVAESATRQIAAARERIRIQITVEVRNAAAALETAGQRIEAARAARAAADIQLRAEEDRLTAGATTPFFVLTRQNDLAAAEVAEAAATAAYRRALTELARARGTLLRDRAVDWRTHPMTRHLVPVLGGRCLALTACRQAVDPTLIRLNGRIEAAMVDLSPKVTGRVREVLVKEGDRVKAGDVLVRLDLGETGLAVARDKSAVAAAQARVRDLEAGTRRSDLAAAEAEVNDRQAALELAKKELQRQQFMLERKVGTQRDVDRASTEVDRLTAAVSATSNRLAALREGARRNQVQQARDEVARAETVLEQSQTTVNEGELRAPADTIVVHRFVEPGQLVTPGQPTLTLAFLDRLYVRTFVPEIVRGRVRPGIDADIVVDAYKDKTFKGKVAEIARDAEFTPKQVETRTERVNLVYAAKVDLIGGWSEPLDLGQPAEVLIKDAVITTSDLTRRFGAITALAGITLEVPRGEMFALIGPDGAGKTTFFRLVAGVLAPDVGHGDARHRHLRARAAALRPLPGSVDRREHAAAQRSLQRAAATRPIGGRRGCSTWSAWRRFAPAWPARCPAA